MMPRYFLDLHDENGIILDEDGEEMPDVEAARKEAMMALGEASRDFARVGTDGQLVIRVRDERGPVLSVSVSFETSRRPT
jgi:hypothetical protein